MRFEAVRDFIGRQMFKAARQRGKQVIPFLYSPIVHFHPICGVFDLPMNFEFWAEYNDHMISVADSMMVIKLEGWKESRGVAHEIEVASNLAVPTQFISV